MTKIRSKEVPPRHGLKGDRVYLKCLSINFEPWIEDLTDLPPVLSLCDNLLFKL